MQMKSRIARLAWILFWAAAFAFVIIGARHYIAGQGWEWHTEKLCLKHTGIAREVPCSFNKSMPCVDAGECLTYTDVWVHDACFINLQDRIVCNLFVYNSTLVAEDHNNTDAAGAKQ